MKSTLLATCLVASLLAGCAATSPEWEARFGDAARQARASQAIDPAASSRNTGIGRTDGKALAGVQNAYADSYGYAVKEVKQPAISITTNTGK